jgi:hypothetical protein
LERVAHRVGFRHLTDGVWREPGDLVDASDWSNRLVLEQNGYLHPFSDAERARLESSPVARPSSVAPIPNAKVKAR